MGAELLDPSVSWTSRSRPASATDIPRSLTSLTASSGVYQTGNTHFACLRNVQLSWYAPKLQEGIQSAGLRILISQCKISASDL